MGIGYDASGNGGTGADTLLGRIKRWNLKLVMWLF